MLDFVLEKDLKNLPKYITENGQFFLSGTIAHLFEPKAQFGHNLRRRGICMSLFGTGPAGIGRHEQPITPRFMHHCMPLTVVQFKHSTSGGYFYPGLPRQADSFPKGVLSYRGLLETLGTLQKKCFNFLF